MGSDDENAEDVKLHVTDIETGPSELPGQADSLSVTVDQPVLHGDGAEEYSPGPAIEAAVQGRVVLDGSPLRGLVSRQGQIGAFDDFGPALSDKGWESDEEEMDGGLRKLISAKRFTIRNSDAYVTCIMRAHAQREQNKKMKSDMKERLYVLDTKYNRYSMIADRIQISVIVLATASAFVQAASDAMGMTSVALGIMSLCVSTYTGLLLSIAKYTKLDEKKECIHNLQMRFSEFITNLDHRDEELGIWTVDTMWARERDHGEDDTMTKRYDEWIEVEKKLLQDLPSVFSTKSQLCGEFDKVMDSGAQSALGLYAREERLHLRQRRNALKKRETLEMSDRIQVDTEFSDVQRQYKDLETKNRFISRSRLNEEIANASGGEPTLLMGRQRDPESYSTSTNQDPQGEGRRALEADE
jgi:hypothetical protein